MININFKNFNIKNDSELYAINGIIEFSNDDLTLVYVDDNAYFYNSLFSLSNNYRFEGEVSLNHKNIELSSINNVQSIRMHKIDLISSHSNLISNLNVIENVTFALGADSKKDPLLSLKQFELESLGHLFPRNLSKVQRLTVSLVQSIIRNVELIIIDCLLDEFDGIEVKEINDVLRKCCDYFNKRIIVLTKKECFHLNATNIYTLSKGFIEKKPSLKTSLEKEVKS